MNTSMREKKLAYLALAKEGVCLLCSFCRFGISDGGSACDGGGYTECGHKLSERLSMIHSEFGMEPGDDCWAFRPLDPIDIVADIIGLLLGNEGWPASWVKRKNGTYAVYITKET